MTTYLAKSTFVKNLDTSLLKGIYPLDANEFPELVNMGIPLGLYLKKNNKINSVELDGGSNDGKIMGGSMGFNVADTVLMETFFNDFGKEKTAKFGKKNKKNSGGISKTKKISCK